MAPSGRILTVLFGVPMAVLVLVAGRADARRHADPVPKSHLSSEPTGNEQRESGDNREPETKGHDTRGVVTAPNQQVCERQPERGDVQSGMRSRDTKCARVWYCQQIDRSGYRGEHAQSETSADQPEGSTSPESVARHHECHIRCEGPQQERNRKRDQGRMHRMPRDGGYTARTGAVVVLIVIHVIHLVGGAEGSNAEVL